MLSFKGKVIAFQGVAIALLCVALFFSHSTRPDEITKVIRDTVRTVEKDTSYKSINLGWLDTDPQPTDTLQEADTAQASTKQAKSSCPDTTIIQRPVYTYTRTVDQPLVSGTITTTVRGEMLRQHSSLSVLQPTIKRRVRTRISTRTTKIRRERLQLLAAGSARMQGLVFNDATFGAGVRLPGRGSLVYQYGAFTGSHQIMLTTPVFSF
jgi:hypothetical protein